MHDSVHAYQKEFHLISQVAISCQVSLGPMTTARKLDHKNIAKATQNETPLGSVYPLKSPMSVDYLPLGEFVTSPKYPYHFANGHPPKNSIGYSEKYEGVIADYSKFRRE